MKVVTMPKAPKKATTEPVGAPSVEPWVDTAAVARHIGFSYQQTAKMVKEGLIPGKPFCGGKRTFWRFKLSEVDAWLKAGHAQRQVG